MGGSCGLAGQVARYVEESVDVVHGPAGLAFGVGELGELVGLRAGTGGPGGDSGEDLVGGDGRGQLFSVKSSRPVAGFAGFADCGI
ncbi:hypothetical protein IGB19_15380 [Streptomyces sp. AC04842]|nr:hypothetical protein [Streptomyces sp. AC04842]